MSYKTKKELIEAVEAAGFEKMSDGNYYVSGEYVLSHGEYERPEYRPTRYKDGWSLKALYFYYQGTFYAPEDGRVDFWIEDQCLIIEEVKS